MRTRNQVAIALFRSRVSQRYLWPTLERRGLIWFVTVDRELYVLRWDDR